MFKALIKLSDIIQPKRAVFILLTHIYMLLNKKISCDINYKSRNLFLKMS